MGFVFHKLHITENTVDVPDNLLYLQHVFRRYSLKQHAERQCLPLRRPPNNLKAIPNTVDLVMDLLLSCQARKHS